MSEEPTAKRLSYSLHGLQQATLRVQDAHWHRPEDAFVAAAEAVSWAVALDNILAKVGHMSLSPTAYKKQRSESEDGKTVIGMRFVRNQAHHAAELFDFVCATSVIGATQFGLRAGWMWTALDDLEPLLDPEQTDGKGLYGSFLGGRSVLDSLLNANRWFASLSPPLPDLPPDPSGSLRPAFQLPEKWPPQIGDRRI